MAKLAVIAHNMRSIHNVGSLLRTADGLGVDLVYLSGYTAYPLQDNDERLPHLAKKLDAQIHKTALGAERTVNWRHTDTLNQAVQKLKEDGYTIIALEQNEKSILLSEYTNRPDNIALLLGSEREGLSQEELEYADQIIEIPMKGSKESFNVVQAAAICLYTLSNLS